MKFSGRFTEFNNYDIPDPNKGAASYLSGPLSRMRTDHLVHLPQRLKYFTSRDCVSIIDVHVAAATVKRCSGSSLCVRESPSHCPYQSQYYQYIGYDVRATYAWYPGLAVSSRVAAETLGT